MYRSSIVIVISLFLAACGASGNANLKANSGSNASANNTGSTSGGTLPALTPVPPESCPKQKMAVADLRMSPGAGYNPLASYIGCTLSVEGKLYDLQSTSATLIPTFERSNANGVVYCAGNFTASEYTDIGARVSDMKMRQQYDKLPTVTFTCKVDGSGYITLTNCVLADAQKAY